MRLGRQRRRKRRHASPPARSVVDALDGIEWDAETYIADAVDGNVSITLKNDSSLPHNLHLIDAEATKIGVALEVPGATTTTAAPSPLTAGTYQVICTVPGHGAMKATSSSDLH